VKAGPEQYITIGIDIVTGAKQINNYV